MAVDGDETLRELDAERRGDPGGSFGLHSFGVTVEPGSFRGDDHPRHRQDRFECRNRSGSRETDLAGLDRLPQREMRLFELVRARDWVPVAGYGAYVATLSAGYYYNVTFVQLGMIDLGSGTVGLDDRQVSLAMAGFALGALVASLVTGRSMDVRGWGTDLRVKLRVLTAVAATQLALTATSPGIETPLGFTALLVISSLGIGVGIPVTFGLMGDLIPVSDRGAVAAATAGIAFFAAAMYPLEWRIEQFSLVMSIAMAPAVLALGLLSFRPSSLIDRLGRQHHEFGSGRFATAGVGKLSFGLVVGVMFAVFFIDSLGFLRLVDTPAYISTSWQSPEIGVRAAIATMHLVGAGIAGILYSNFHWRWLVLGVFGLFAFSHLLYTFHIRFGVGSEPPFVMPMMYVLAVSFYTTLNFALWPDLSTTENMGRRTALGVGVAGWLASFASTSAALYSKGAGVSLLTHLTYVEALALVSLFVLPIVLYLRRVLAASRSVRT